MSDDDMCPNCVTPWKCNWPPISGDVHKTHYADDDTLAYIAKLEEEIARLKAEIASDRMDASVIYQEQDAEIARLKGFPRATSQPLGTNDWVIDVPYLKRIKRTIRETFKDEAYDSLDLEQIEQVLLAVEAYRAACPKEGK